MFWGRLCGLLGLLGFAAWLSIETYQRQHAGWFESAVYGVVTRSRRPRLFRFVVIGSWFYVGLILLGTLVVVRLR
jgi:hypothetical protein